METATFNWWIGIIEDRADPEFLGRYRVRIIGYHTGNKTSLPTADLPWAVPVMPTTTAAMSGVGTSGGSMVEGSTVIGFFADGNDEQQPIILGTFAGNPQRDANNKDPDGDAYTIETKDAAIKELEKLIDEAFFDNDRERYTAQLESLQSIDSDVGFTDPRKIYPRSETGTGYNGLKEPDGSRLSRGPDAELHASQINKRATRLGEEGTAIPIATAPSVESVADDKPGKTYDRTFWEEPQPRFGKISYDAGSFTFKDVGKQSYVPHGTQPSPDNIIEGETSLYPFNRVVEYEQGHVTEVDDTPDNGRIHEYHNSGTFSEIQHDGKKITKVVGDQFDITIMDKRVFIGGTCSVTIQGDAKLYVQGDSYEEVDGNKFTTIKGDRVTKIGGNDLLEVITDQNTQINGARGTRVGGDDSETIVGSQTHSVALNKLTTVNKDTTEKLLGEVKTTVGKSYAMLVAKNYNVGAAGNVAIGAGGTSNVKSIGNMKIETDGTQNVYALKAQVIETAVQQTLKASNTDITQDLDITGTSTASVDHNSAGISGKSHTHTDTAGTAAGTTTAPN